MTATLFDTVRIVIEGAPATKKNSQRIVMAGGRPRLVPSAAYKAYEEAAGWQIPGPARNLGIDCPVSVKAVYHMPTRRKVDLVNLLEATCDILVKFGVLKDDSSDIVAAHDGSRVLYDKERPRAEIDVEPFPYIASSFPDRGRPGETVHDLGILPYEFAAVLSGRKRFEIRRGNDFREGDKARLREWDFLDGAREHGDYTGRMADFRISYVTRLAQKDGFVVIGLEEEK